MDASIRMIANHRGCAKNAHVQCYSSLFPDLNIHCLAKINIRSCIFMKECWQLLLERSFFVRKKLHELWLLQDINLNGVDRGSVDSIINCAWLCLVVCHHTSVSIFRAEFHEALRLILTCILLLLFGIPIGLMVLASHSTMIWSSWRGMAIQIFGFPDFISELFFFVKALIETGLCLVSSEIAWIKTKIKNSELYCDITITIDERFRMNLSASWKPPLENKHNPFQFWTSKRGSCWWLKEPLKPVRSFPLYTRDDVTRS
jgi:hypothetical protein